MRDANRGNLSKAAGFLSSYTLCKKHANDLRALTVEPAEYDGWPQAQAHFAKLEAVGLRLAEIGL